jgi:hypothetical protein
MEKRRLVEVRGGQPPLVHPLAAHKSFDRVL